jgi:membrane associated rhomboid family serine protease
MMRIGEHPLTWSLIIANVIFFLLVFSMPEGLLESVLAGFGFSAGNAGLVYPWLTSLFLHASASHLFFNMLGLFFFGKILEEEVKPHWFLAIYFISGLLGNLVFMFTSASVVVGASGCVFGVMAAAMLASPTKPINLYVIPLPLGLVAITFILVETLVVYFQPDFGQVAHYSHIAGLLAGAVFAFFYDTRKALKGLLVLAVSLVLLLVFAPVIGLITLFGSLVLEILDMIIGFFLYGLAGLLSFIWL